MPAKYCHAAALLSVVVFSTAMGGEHRLAFESRADSRLIRVDDQPLATYVYHDPRIVRPYFKDLCAPGGVQVTRHYPPREGIDPGDHPTMHPGLWLAFGDLGGADFWRNKATVEHAGFVGTPRVEGDKGTFTVHNRYVADGAVLCDETCTYTFQVQPAGCLILWDSTFQSERPDLYFGDQEEMGLGVRVATPIMAKPQEGHARPGRIVDDRGRQNEKAIRGEQAVWCDYSGWVGDTFAGVTIMPHPQNIAPCRWHVRDYGLMVANPFGQSVFKKGPVNRTAVMPGRSFRLRFGVLIHAGDDRLDLAAAYQDYLRLAAPAEPGPSVPATPVVPRE